MSTTAKEIVDNNELNNSDKLDLLLNSKDIPDNVFIEWGKRIGGKFHIEPRNEDEQLYKDNLTRAWSNETLTVDANSFARFHIAKALSTVLVERIPHGISDEYVEEVKGAMISVLFDIINNNE